MRQKRGWRSATLAFAASRFTCGLFVYLGHLQKGDTLSIAGRWEGVAAWWLNPWTLYDSQYYLSIARDGYQAITSPFFPLYPFLLKFGGNSDVGMAAAGFTISNLAFLLSLYLLHRLTEMDYGAKAADGAVWLLAFFPTTPFFSAVYTESLFLLLLLLAFYAARREQWMLAGLAGLVAALTRNPGILISAALAVEYLRNRDFSLRKLEFPHLFFLALPLLGFIGVQAYLAGQVGNTLPGVASQKLFYRAPTYPWVPLWKDAVGFFTYQDYDLVVFVNLFSVAVALLLAFRFRRTLRPGYAVLLFGIILMNLTYALRVPPYTTGTVRYLSTAFPFVQLAGLYATRPDSLVWRFRRAGAGTYLYLLLLFSYMFGLKYFLG